MTTLAQVVRTSVHDNGSTEDGGWANQLDQRIMDGALGDTRGVGGDVTQVTNVSDLIGWGTVGLSEWVEVRTGRGATVGVVTKLVDVEPTLGIGIVTSDLVGDGGWLILRNLFETNNTGHTGVTTQDSNFSLC